MADALHEWMDGGAERTGRGGNWAGSSFFLLECIRVRAWNDHSGLVYRFLSVSSRSGITCISAVSAVFLIRFSHHTLHCPPALPPPFSFSSWCVRVFLGSCITHAFFVVLISHVVTFCAVRMYLCVCL